MSIKTEVKEVTTERQIQRDDVDAYVQEGWKFSHNIGNSSAIIKRTEKIKVEIPKTRIEQIEEQIHALEVEKKALSHAAHAEKK